MLSYANNFIGTLVLSTLEIFDLRIHRRKFYVEIFFENLKKIVWDCLPIVTLTIGATALIYAIHSAPEFSRRGLTKYIGGLIALALTRETVPVMGALALITQYCTGMTAQIASMKVTEQIDALRISNVSPVNYLLIPMVLACMIGFPILAIIGIIFGSIVGFIATDFLIDTNYHMYLSSIEYAIVPGDIAMAIVKTATFGCMVALISYTCGILTRGGSKAVGVSTRMSVILNFATVMVLDYVITAMWL